MKRIEDVHILVVGDCGIDEYIYTEMNRISPEAPVPIVNYKRHERKLGLAGNVINNIHSIGAKVSFIGSIGTTCLSDNYDLVEMLNSKCQKVCLLKKENTPTTVKKRIIANNQQMVMRIDIEDDSVFEFSHRPHKLIKMDLKQFNIIIISDYNKGFINYDLMEFILTFKNDDCKVIVDPSPKSCWETYGQVYLIKPNEKEYNHYASNCMEFIESDYILKTLGKKGMELYKYTGNEFLNPCFFEHIKSFESEAKNVFDVTGCGDTVIAILGVCLDMGYNIEHSVYMANKAAGISASYQGTYSLTREEFEQIHYTI